LWDIYGTGDKIVKARKTCGEKLSKNHGVAKNISMHLDYFSMFLISTYKKEL